MRLLQGVGLLSDERIELLLSWRHTGFSVHNRVRVEPEDQPAVERLACYIMRPPISLERVQWGGEGVVHYRAKGGHGGRTLPPGDAAEAFDPAEFVARVIMHIPEPRRHLVRYYGAYSNVARGRRKQLGASRAQESVDVAPRPPAEEQDGSPDARSLRRRWRELIKRVYEVGPAHLPAVPCRDASHRLHHRSHDRGQDLAPFGAQGRGCTRARPAG